MQYWYDISDIVDWKLPHFTGIQRTTIGILKGLIENNITPKLIYYNTITQTFNEINYENLPFLVLKSLNYFANINMQLMIKSKNLNSNPSIYRRTKNIAKSIESILAMLIGQSTANYWYKYFSKQTKSYIAQNPILPRFPCKNGDVFISTGATWAADGRTELMHEIQNNGTIVCRLIYDLIPTLKPQWVLPSHTKIITIWAKALLKNSDLVLTISKFCKNEIEKFCIKSNIQIPKIDVVRLGDEKFFSNDYFTNLSTPRFVPKKDFFIFVSSIDIRKNHKYLYDAWKILTEKFKENTPNLLLIGNPHLHVKDIIYQFRLDPEINRNVFFLEKINDAELEWYYSNCVATLYPSLYEGWGLPVAESLVRGKISIASDIPSIREINQQLVLFCDPFNPYSLVDHISKLLNDSYWKSQLERDISSQYTPTTWKQTAHSILNGIYGTSHSLKAE